MSALFVFASVSAASTTGPGGTTLRHVNALSTRTHRALLDLYSIDTRLRTAQQRSTALRAASVRLAHEQALLVQQIAATSHTLAISRHTLGNNLRVLYKQGDVNAIAVVLGARSLDDAIGRLDELTSVADQSRRIVLVASRAELRLEDLRASLRERRRSLATALAGERQAEASLAASRLEHVRFVAGLRSRERLASAQVAALRVAARHAVEKSAVLQVAAGADAAVPPPAVRVAGTRTITVSSTGYSLAGSTATGMPTGRGVVAVDPAVIPLGTRLSIPGYGEGVAADTGGGVHGDSIDLWFPTRRQAGAWGRRTVTITLH